MFLSHWETDEWLNGIDFCIVGSGITGLNCALALKEKHSKAKILILERGILPLGASTKNAGFACFGSVSEILEDLQHNTEENVINLYHRRWEGLKLLRKLVGDKNLNYQQLGGYELFLTNNRHLYKKCQDNLSYINNLVEKATGLKQFQRKNTDFGFRGVYPDMLFNPYEGQLHPGKMVQALIRRAIKNGIKILNGVEVTNYIALNEGVKIETPFFDIKATAFFIATNGFAKKINRELTVEPARAQVLLTKPIKNLQIKGCFHLHMGYYYFRNVKNRILLGGGRHLAFKKENIDVFANNALIMRDLSKKLKKVILPESPFEIESSWSGIMGIGEKKEPILKEIAPQVFCAVRLGGMGVALGAMTGRDLAALIN